jgi:hypothetical protein
MWAAAISRMSSLIRACTGTTDPICLDPANPTSTTIGSLRSFSALNSTTATLAQKGIVIENGVPHGYISLGQLRTQERRPDPTLGRFVNLQNFGWSYYHAGTVKVTKRYSNGLSFNAFYTFSKAIDTGSEQTFTVVDTNAPASKKGGAAASLRGLSAYHAAHRFVASYSYELPILRDQRGLAGRVIGGWNVSGTTTLQSGNPFSVTLGYDANGDGLGGDRPRVADLSILGASVDNGRRNAQGSAAFDAATTRHRLPPRAGWHNWAAGSSVSARRRARRPSGAQHLLPARAESH